MITYIQHHEYSLKLFRLLFRPVYWNLSQRDMRLKDLCRPLVADFYNKYIIMSRVHVTAEVWLAAYDKRREFSSKSAYLTLLLILKKTVWNGSRV